MVAIVPGVSGSWSAWTRQGDIAERGVQVMPFDLERTTHVFERLSDAECNSVVADDPSHEEQIRLIRMHLQEEAETFRRGDFGDPATIHGQSMPGLDALCAAAGEIEVRYSETPTGRGSGTPRRILRWSARSVSGSMSSSAITDRMRPITGHRPTDLPAASVASVRARSDAAPVTTREKRGREL